MVEIWFALLGLLLAAYAALDGFDLGVGIVHRFLGRTEEERGMVLAAIGPFWDGNEVCLIAAGGTLFLAFPALLGAALSGFYLAIFFVLWSLALRGLSIELRGHVRDPLWKSFWDTIFALSSSALAFLFGVALANVVRGVPLEEDGYFDLVLFTNFLPWGDTGLLDAYTVLAGVSAVFLLGTHGAVYLSWKVQSELAERSHRLARRLALVAAPLLVLVTVATFLLRPDMGRALLTRPLGWLSLVALIGAVITLGLSLRAGVRAARRAFLASSGVILGVLAATAIGTFPVMLASTHHDVAALTAHAAAAPDSSLKTALYWWPLAAVLASSYFVMLFRLHRGRIDASEH